MKQVLAAFCRNHLHITLGVAAIATCAVALWQPGQALAQATKKDAPAAAGKGDLMPGVQWFKICDTVQSVKAGVATDVKLCRTHLRALDATTGNLLSSVTIAKVEGRDKEIFALTVPLGTAIKAGVRVKIDDDDKPLALEYTQCSPLGCQGEIELTPEFLAKMKKGKVMFVAVVGADGKALGIPIQLAGFSKAYDGEPTDTKVFAEVQNARQQAILERRAELQKRAAEEPKKAPAPAAAAPAPAAPAPAKKRLE
ncbi:MAG: invasion associated locus B family protein [Pseudomonadota bacterium]|nr:invasion associated locus B family protein [Pseudomonadota bacterium]